MKINLHVERLILDGLPIGARQGALIQSAIETELGRLLSEGGLASDLIAGGVLSRLPASSIHLTNDTTPARLGQQIAGAVHSGIGGETSGGVLRSRAKQQQDQRTRLH